MSVSESHRSQIDNELLQSILKKNGYLNAVIIQLEQVFFKFLLRNRPFFFKENQDARNKEQISRNGKLEFKEKN